MKTTETLASWNSAYWLFSTIGIPAAVPWIIYKLIFVMIYKRRKASLRGKVKKINLFYSFK